MPTIYVLNVPEFLPIVEAAKAKPDCQVDDVGLGYFRVKSEGALEFDRRALGFKPAVWYGIFTGGIQGRIKEYGRDKVRIEGDATV